MLTTDNVNMMELCFNNGEKYMKEQIISKLMDYKTTAKSEIHSVMVEIIELVSTI